MEDLWSYDGLSLNTKFLLVDHRPLLLRQHCFYIVYGIKGLCMIQLNGVLRRFQHYYGHITATACLFMFVLGPHSIRFRL